MTSRIARSLVAALLCAWTGMSVASVTAIDLSKVPDLTGTSGYGTVQGPCYCDQNAYFSPIMVLAPGTYDFGKVRDYWVVSGYTPDGGPDQSLLWLLFAPVETSGDYPYVFPVRTTYVYPQAYDLCAQDDDACNARYQSAYVDFDLVYTVSGDDNAIQIALIGSYQYIPPVPEPAGLAMFALGALLAGAMARRGGGRARRA